MAHKTLYLMRLQRRNVRHCVEFQICGEDNASETERDLGWAQEWLTRYSNTSQTMVCATGEEGPDMMEEQNIQRFAGIWESREFWKILLSCIEIVHIFYIPH
jgi:hypothetical protein